MTVNASPDVARVDSSTSLSKEVSSDPSLRIRQEWGGDVQQKERITLKGHRQREASYLRKTKTAAKTIQWQPTYSKNLLSIIKTRLMPASLATVTWF